MRRVRSVVAVAAVTAAMAAFAGPAMADVDFDDSRNKKFEERLDERADLVEDSYDELEDTYEDGFFYYSPFVVYDIDDVWDLD
jgi:hypothetical protein